MLGRVGVRLLGEVDPQRIRQGIRHRDDQDAAQYCSKGACACMKSRNQADRGYDARGRSEEKPRSGAVIAEKPHQAQLAKSIR